MSSLELEPQPVGAQLQAPSAPYSKCRYMQTLGTESLAVFYSDCPTEFWKCVPFQVQGGKIVSGHGVNHQNSFLCVRAAARGEAMSEFLLNFCFLPFQQVSVATCSSHRHLLWDATGPCSCSCSGALSVCVCALLSHWRWPRSVLRLLLVKYCQTLWINSNDNGSELLFSLV